MVKIASVLAFQKFGKSLSFSSRPSPSQIEKRFVAIENSIAELKKCLYSKERIGPSKDVDVGTGFRVFDTNQFSRTDIDARSQAALFAFLKEYYYAPGCIEYSDLIDSEGNFVSQWGGMVVATDPITMKYKLFPLLAKHNIDKETVLQVSAKKDALVNVLRYMETAVRQKESAEFGRQMTYYGYFSGIHRAEIVPVVCGRYIEEDALAELKSQKCFLHGGTQQLR